MNSHIVEKTMHSIKNIDRLTDLAAIDVYNTTHDTINKYEIMKEHATEEYTNESFYQESVLAGVLIGAGVLGVAISAFFIIKKIIDSKDSADSSVKSADGKMVAAQVDLSDPKSTEKYLSDLKARLEKLTETKSIKVTKSINKGEFEAAEKKINTWSEQLQEMIDNKHEAAEIEKIIDGMDISSVDVSKIFVNNEVDASVADFAEALGLRSISSFASLLSSLKKKIDDVEKMVNNKKDKEAENPVQISQDHLTKLKNQNNDAAKLIAALKSQSKETLRETDKAVLGAINAETEAKKKDEEAKTAEKSADTEAAENKAEKDGSTKPEAQPTDDAGSGAGGNDNAGIVSSTSDNVMGSGGQTERMQQASEAKQAAEAEAKNKNVLYLNPKEDTQKDETGTPVIPAAAEKKANEKTLEDVTNMLKSGQSEEDVRNALAKNNYKTEQIDAFLTEANNRIVNERKSELLNQTLGGTKPKVLDGEVLPPETEAKPFKFPKKGDDTFNNNRQEQGIDKVVENIRRLIPADSEEGSWDKIVPTLKTYGFKDDEINDYAVRNNIIPSKSQDTPAPVPTDQNTDENTRKTTPEQSSENQQQTQSQQNVNQNPNGINIKDINNIITQASYDGISKDISESICKNVIDDISSNTPFNVANRVKDEAVKLKTDQKLYFTDAAKRILRVYANAIADIEPQTDAVKKYAEDVKQASEMDLSLIEPPVSKQGNLESPKEYVNKVATLIKQIPGAIPNKAKELADSEYGSLKNDIANDIAKQLDEPEATNFRNAYASIINGSATGNIDENQLSSFGDAAAAVNTNNSANQQDQSNNSQNSVASPQESIDAINEDITRAIENARLSDTAKQDLFKISGENIINSIVQSIEQLGGKQAQPEQVCSMVNGTLCNRVYKLIHDAIMQDRKFLQRPVFNTMSKYGEAVTTLCSQVRDICAKMLVSYYNIPVNMVDQIVVPFESYKNNKNSVMYKWFREYEIDVIRDKKIQMIMESQQQEEQKSE